MLLTVVVEAFIYSFLKDFTETKKDENGTIVVLILSTTLFNNCGDFSNFEHIGENASVKRIIHEER